MAEPTVARPTPQAGATTATTTAENCATRTGAGATIARTLILVALILGLVVTSIAPATAATPNPTLGCGGSCILGGSAVRGPFAMTLKVRTGVLARLTVKIAERTVNGKPATVEHPQYVVTPTFETQHTVSFNHLQAGTTYDVEVIATDRAARTDRRTSRVTTLRREVTFTIHRIDILNDADTGGPGEVSFYNFIGSQQFTDPYNHQYTVNSGDRVRIDLPTRHVGIGPLNTITVIGQECDAFAWICTWEHGSSDWAKASHLVDVDHPGTRGTRTTPYPGIPGGHSGYVTFDTERGSYLRFTVYAYWDVKYVA